MLWSGNIVVMALSYSERELNVVTKYPQLVNQTATDCYMFLMHLEEHYDVSIKFWLSVEMPPTQGVQIWLYATGSGDIFDHMASGKGMARALVIQAQNGSVYPALWAVLTELESNFYTYAGTLIPPSVP